MSENQDRLPSGQPPVIGLRVPSARTTGWSLFGAGVVLWSFSDFVWWVPALGVGLVILARIVLPLIPRSWRSWVVPTVLLALFVVLLAATTAWEWLVAAGLVGLVLGARRWPQWQPLAIAGGVLLVGAGGTGWQAWQAHQMQRQIAQQQHEQTVARMLPPSPSQVVSSMLTLISRDDEMTCALFSDTAKQQFAHAHGVQDCEQAVHRLAEQVTDRQRYESPPPGSFDAPQGVRSVVNTCSMSWNGFFQEAALPDPGPKPGVFAVEQQQGAGFLITTYRACR